ncbi:MAG: radical SAM protein [Sedimentisphaerales bacterium]|nr:radical SAM protein [Sedimentisphaerales bacterium]
MKILLVNPPIYDFAAYDFWLKPYGLLSVAGYLRGKADFTLFDYLDRLHPFAAARENLQSDQWGRGRFYQRQIQKPPSLKQIPRRFRRFGLPREIFREYLTGTAPPDYVLIQTMMTYWYPGVQEVIEDIRTTVPKAKIILGGNYVTLCPAHADTLGADLCIHGTTLALLWDYLALEPDLDQPALWEAYDKLNVGVLKITQGCPFKCTYCSVPKVYGDFAPRPIDRCLAEMRLLLNLGVKNIAFYDDALLFNPEKALTPFLEEIISPHDIQNTTSQKTSPKRKRRGIHAIRDTQYAIRIPNLHSPNALNARFLTKDLADLMLRAGFKTFYLGFESASAEWQKQTGSKVFCEELAQAVDHLKAAGANPQDITAYQILGHPKTDSQQLEQSMQFVNSLGIRGMLADFSPIPGTPDGDYCAKYVDMTEPLNHNKTAFPITLLAFKKSNQLKDLQRTLNRNLPSSTTP